MKKQTTEVKIKEEVNKLEEAKRLIAEEEKKEYPNDEGYKGVFINAHIAELNGEEWAYNEGCLSIPKIREDVYRKTAIIGYWLSEELWGRGIMPEAVKLMTNYVFTHFDFIRVQASVYSKNPASMRVLEKAGFRREGLLRSYLRINGIWQDHYLYARIADDPPGAGTKG